MTSIVSFSSISLPENGGLTFLALCKRAFDDVKQIFSDNCNIQLFFVNKSFYEQNHKKKSLSLQWN